MANYHLALNVVYFVSLVVLIRKLLGIRFNSISRLMTYRGNEHATRTDAGKKSLLERIRDWAFPKIPMV